MRGPVRFVTSRAILIANGTVVVRVVFQQLLHVGCLHRTRGDSLVMAEQTDGDAVGFELRPVLGRMRVVTVQAGVGLLYRRMLNRCGRSAFDDLGMTGHTQRWTIGGQLVLQRRSVGIVATCAARFEGLMAKLRCLESRLHVRMAGETERRSGDSNKVRRSRAVWIMTGDTSADRNRPVSLRADETLFVVALKAERLGGSR